MRKGVDPAKRFWLIMGVWLAAFAEARGQVVNTPPVPDWIQAPGNKANEPAFFRVGVDLPPKMLKVIFLGASEGDMQVFVNGRLAGREGGTTGSVSMDLTSALDSGKNVIGIRVVNAAGPARVSALIELNADFAQERWVATSPRWLARTTHQEGWSKIVTTPEGWKPALSSGRVDAIPEKNPFDPRKRLDAYNSWKLAIGSGAATDPVGFSLPTGFKAELVRSALPGEDSWVSMAFDSQGRLTLAREKRGLLRVTLEKNQVSKVELLDQNVLECRGLLYIGTSLYANANNSKTLVRLIDADGDGVFEMTEELLKTEGGVGHGRNHIKHGPDGWLYVAHGNNVKPPTQISPHSPLKRIQEDQLIPNPWDAGMFDGDVLAPAGHVLRLNPANPAEVQLFAGGFRNPMDLAFNADGELFTFDADMEWDVGSPWYMPNRVLHVVPGADFGFRRGTGRFRSHFPDTLPSVVDVGLASPTAVIFGTGAKFPAKYQKALFVCDWAYGRILAVHCEETGASFRGRAELFLSGRPLNVTDVCVGPDGAMWFITGGRATQSGLYRVAYSGSEPGALEIARPTPSKAEAAAARDLRRRLESFEPPSSIVAGHKPFEEVWDSLGSSDRWIRFAARGALERVPSSQWIPRAVEEKNNRRLITAALALVRTEAPAQALGILELLAKMRWSDLAEDEAVGLVRALSIAFARGGAPSQSLRTAVLAQLEPIYPTPMKLLNPDLCRLLVFLKSSKVLSQSLPMIAAATASEDLLEYPLLLRYIKEGWDLEARRVCLEALARAAKLPGAQNYFRTIHAIRTEIEMAMTPLEREKLLSTVSSNSPKTAPPPPALAKVRDWTLEELIPHLVKTTTGRSEAGGKAALLKAQCTACHTVSADPPLASGVQGPDLAQVSSRFGKRDLLDHILNPSKVVDEKFLQTTFVTQDGSEITGVVEREEGGKVIIRQSLLSEQTLSIPLISVRERRISALSPMPEGLLSVLALDEVLDLLAFFEMAAKPSVPP